MKKVDELEIRRERSTSLDLLEVSHSDHLWTSISSVQKMHDDSGLKREQTSQRASTRKNERRVETHKETSSIGRDGSLSEPDIERERSETKDEVREQEKREGRRGERLTRRR